MARKQTARRGAKTRSRRSSAKARSGAKRKASARRPPRRKAAAVKARPKVRKAAAKRPSKTKPAKRPTAPVRIAAAAAGKAAAAPSPSAIRHRRAPSLDRSRRHLPEVENNVPTPPSSLDMDRSPSAARSGRQVALVARSQHNETSPELTGGDVDANWEDAYSVGDEAPGGDNPTPDQDRVDDIGKALGVEYQDNEELKAADKITKRDRHRWELDPASSEDYQDRD
jgi:hypothetical protein